MKSILSIATLLFLLASCSSLPSREEMQKNIADYNLPHKSKEGYGIVYVLRPSVLGSIVRFNVFLDDKEDESEMGWNRGMQFHYFYAKPGIHTVYSKAENWASIDVNVENNKPTFIEQEATMGIIMARNNLVKIDELVGTYQVKKLAEGSPSRKSKLLLGRKFKKKSA